MSCLFLCSQVKLLCRFHCSFVTICSSGLNHSGLKSFRFYLYSRIQAMSTQTKTRSRGGRARVTEGAVENDKSQMPSKRSIKSRKPVKIEVEQDADEDELQSKYFKAEPSPNKNDGQSDEPILIKPEKSESDLASATETEPVPTTSSTPSKKKVKPEPVKVVPPDNWRTILENIKIMRSSKTAVVDSMGCERTADLSKSPKVQRFHTLVSLMLSSQTKDQVTYAAMERLKARDLTVQSMLDVDETELAELLKPVSFYKRKSVYIKKTAEILREKYQDDIPRTVEDLCALPGVGPKMAYICMNAAWNENAGIGVDTHVHRISNRLKWTGKNGTNTPEKTREALESWMPRELWQEFNILLVGFGQETCLPIGPKCGICLNKDICPASTARSSNKPKGKKKGDNPS